jgi:hypothetical protein
VGADRHGEVNSNILQLRGELAEIFSAKLSVLCLLVTDICSNGVFHKCVIRSTSGLNVS